MAINNPYWIVIAASAFMGLCCIACSAMFLKEKNPWVPLIKGCGLSFCIMFIGAMIWTVI